MSGSGGASGGASAGTTSSGGTTNSGGAPNLGGATAAGGASAKGGSTSTGGVPSGGAGGSTGGATSSCPAATPLTGGNRYCSNQTGTVSGSSYSWELWAEGMGSGCMTVHGKDATFSANWNNVEDLLARVGLTFDRTRTHKQIGTISAEFAETKTGSNGLVYVGIYGWTVNPLTEYYILDDWGAIKPAGTASDGSPRTSVGTITVDGEVYDVWSKLRENKPSILGDSSTFYQYFSIRRTARQCGKISISEHFTKWEGLGVQLGQLTEAKLLMEAQDSTGTIAFTKATVTVAR